MADYLLVNFITSMAVKINQSFHLQINSANQVRQLNRHNTFLYREKKNEPE